MIQITSTGNNFGGNAITFRTYQNGNFLILNGRLTIQTNTPQFAAAERLEIYVPELSIKRSVDTALYVLFTYNGDRAVTIARSWIKNATTICIEKMASFSGSADIELVFCCLYTTRGKSLTTTPAAKAPVSFTGFGDTYELEHQQCVDTPDWFHLCAQVRGMKDKDMTQPFQFGMSGVAENQEYDFLLICINQDHTVHGNLFSNAHFKELNVSCTGIPALTERWNKTFLIHGFFVK